jgi:soluble lytic murein transglycosylase-like protein
MRNLQRDRFILVATVMALALIMALLPSSATRWMPEVERAAQAAGVPVPLFRALVRQESAFNHWAVSPRGAIGLAQLMPDTARSLGVNPHDPRANLRGGAIYLRRMLDRFGDVRTALMAYNWGPTNVARWIKGGRDPARVPKETRAYLAGIEAYGGFKSRPAAGGTASR